MRKVSEMKIAIIGSGVTGQATGIGLNHHKHITTFYDIDLEKLDNLEKKGYLIARNIDAAVDKSDIIFLCVPTPTTNKRINLKIIKEATKNIGNALKKCKDYKTIVVKSTVIPSTTRKTVLPILEQYSGKKVGMDLGLCSNPEFLTEKNAIQDFLHPDRTIIGEYDPESGEVLAKLYEPFNAPIIRTSLENAEMIKYISNIFLAAKISFFNETYLICKKLGIDPQIVSAGVAYDPRIGKYGVKGGKPFEGSCLPKDLEAFLGYMEDEGIDAIMFKKIHELNNIMKEKSK